MSRIAEYEDLWSRLAERWMAKRALARVKPPKAVIPRVPENLDSRRNCRVCLRARWARWARHYAVRRDALNESRRRRRMGR